MRIERLVFERYGLFTDKALAFAPDAALHIVLGANEAGKTSALAAIGDLLFGFGGRTEYDFRHDTKILRIGGSFRHSDGRVVTARRRKGNKNTLVDADDQPLPDDLLAPLLAGLSRDAFSREFGLTAQALREGGHELLTAGGRLAETLAASSAGMAALSRTRQRLQDEADELFTPRKSAGKPFYVALERRDDADRALRDAIVTREAIAQAETAVEEARQQLDQLSDAHRDAGVTLALWQRTLRVRSHLARLEGIGAELATLADLPEVPAHALAEWRAALDADAGLARDIAALDAAAAADAADIAAMAVDETLLSQGSAIDALRERLGAVRKALEDLPRRRQARDLAEGALDAAAHRLGLSSHAQLLARRPTDPAQAQARELIELTKRAGQAIAEAEARQARAQQEHDAFAAEESHAVAVVDIEQLRQRFDALGDIPAQADRLRRDSTALAVETSALAAAAASLDPSPGALDQLRALPLPDHTAIAKFAHATELSDADATRLAEAVATQDEAIVATEAELARLSSDGIVPSRADLSRARRERDEQLNGLRVALDGDPGMRVRRFDEVVRSSQAIDRVTDLLLTDTERATRHDDARQRLAAYRDERDRIAAKLAGLQARLAEVDIAWRNTWAASGLTPRGPAEMLRWRERFDDILARLGRRDAEQAGIDALAANLDSGKAAVLSFLDSTGRVPDRSLAPDLLFREAKARFEELQAAWAEAKARSVAEKRIERDLTEATSAREIAQATLDRAHEAWPAAMTGIGLSGEATSVQAEAALSVWHTVAVPKASFEGEGHRVATIESDLIAFDRDVFAVVDRVAPQLRSQSAQDAVARLAEQLAAARRDSETCRRLREAAVKRAASRDALVAKRAATEAVLDDACRVLGVAGIAELAEPLERTSARHRYETDRAGLRRDLYAIADGRDEAALRQERDGLDLDRLPGDIDRQTLAQAQLLKDIAEASALHHQAQGEFNTLVKGRDAAAQAAERADAGAELLSIAERWLLRAAASRLAARAIERHRAMVQDPLIARASALFAMATGDAFSGLGIAYGDDDQPVLVAQRGDGDRLPVAGLSEGTRDQLFLALRLALLERRSSEPMPFIGDDLLTSFDDNRTLATLRLLADAGRRHQIVLFTHHRHVVELAKSVQGHAIDLIEL
ncbi:MAG: AAA family ATPase [Rhodopseudomonas sp.]|uniref:YhaN family protein n=1 Tax=Rhodopseudomonas sp. TaxID=1078 RepID=UPI0017ABB45E|nr:YhaN family protein [Rhodopseudomonas sp.]NVN84939.1 AAA family ATPase [Rhodopseudomonas sp.]